MTGTWAEIGLLKEARYSLLFLFERDHLFLLIETNVHCYAILAVLEQGEKGLSKTGFCCSKIHRTIQLT